MHIIWRKSTDSEVYEAARRSRVFNQRCPDRFPQAVAKVAKESDIISAVKLGAQHKCRIAVRSGGHSFPVWSLHDRSVLIDLGAFKVIDIDEENRIAKVSPSVTSKDLNDVLTEKYGLMFPGGHCPDVGLGGFLLQGGMGWNCRNWGWACERVKEVEVVTVNGDLVVCNEQQNSDLYWAARGAGPGYIYPRSLYKEAFSWVLHVTPLVDEDTEITVVSRYAEGCQEICLSIHFLSIKHTPEQAAAALNPIHETRPSGAIAEWYCREDGLASQYSKQAKANPKGQRYYTDNAYIHNDADVVSALEEAFLNLPHRKSFAFWSAMNPWSRRELPDMALSTRSDHYFAIYTLWDDDEDDERCISWVKKVMKKIEPYSVGTYLGDSDLQKSNAGYWSNTNALRLMKICEKWDPDGLMCRYQSYPLI